jgi:hypothetical protein
MEIIRDKNAGGKKKVIIERMSGWKSAASFSLSLSLPLFFSLQVGEWGRLLMRVRYQAPLDRSAMKS